MLRDKKDEIKTFRCCGDCSHFALGGFQYIFVTSGMFRMLCAIYDVCFVYVLGVLGRERVYYTRSIRIQPHTSQNPHNPAYRLLKPMLQQHPHTSSECASIRLCAPV